MYPVLDANKNPTGGYVLFIDGRVFTTRPSKEGSDNINITIGGKVYSVLGDISQWDENEKNAIKIFIKSIEKAIIEPLSANTTKEIQLLDTIPLSQNVLSVPSGETCKSVLYQVMATTYSDLTFSKWPPQMRFDFGSRLMKSVAQSLDVNSPEIIDFVENIFRQKVEIDTNIIIEKETKKHNRKFEKQDEPAKKAGALI